MQQPSQRNIIHMQLIIGGYKPLLLRMCNSTTENKRATHQHLPHLQHHAMQREVCARTPSIYIAICYAHARQHSRFSCCCCAIFKHRAAMGHAMQRQQQQPNCIRIYNTCKWQLLPSFSICNLESCNILATQSPMLALTCRYMRRYVVCQVCQCC